MNLGMALLFIIRARAFIYFFGYFLIQMDRFPIMSFPPSPQGRFSRLLSMTFHYNSRYLPINKTLACLTCLRMHANFGSESVGLTTIW